MEPTLPPTPNSPNGQRGLPARTILLLLVVVGAGLFAANRGLIDIPGFGVQAEARRVCDEASRGVVLTAAISMTAAIESAPDPGALAAAIREECPEIVNQILEVGSGLDSGGQDLIGRANMQMDTCDQDGARGTVRNNHSAAIDVTIEVQFLSGSRVLLDTGLDFVDGLRPGQTAEWDASYFGESLGFCDPEVTSVRES